MAIEEPASASGPAIAGEIDQLHRKLAALAQRRQWSELAALMQRRDELLSQVTGFDHRARLFRAALRANDSLLKLAQADSQAVVEKLTSLQRHRAASRGYEAHRQGYE